MNVYFEVLIFLSLACISQHYLLLANGDLQGKELIERENIDSPIDVVQLDIYNDEDPFWTFSKGWFQYFDDISDIPENIEREGSNYIVGFPPDFIQEDLLGTEEGMWMVVHSDIPPDSDYPLAYLDFEYTELSEFNSIEIKCYLYGDISIGFIHEDLEVDPVRIENKENVNNDWETILIQTAPFRNLRMQFHPHNGSFIIVDRITISTRQLKFQNSLNSYEQEEAGTNRQEDIKDVNTYANTNEISQQNILDVRSSNGQHYNWKISEGWFSYFNNSYEIPDDIEYGGIPYTVGFPPGFIREDFLDTADGLWMTVHDEFPPIFDVPIPYINFTNYYAVTEWDAVEIKCLLYGNSSLQLTFIDQYDYDRQFTFTNNDTSKYEWDDFCVSTGPFKNFQMKILTEGNNSSFVIVDKIVVTKFTDIDNLEPSTSVGTSTTEDPSTTEMNSYCSGRETTPLIVTTITTVPPTFTTEEPDPSTEPEETTVAESTEAASTETESISTTEEITINTETTTFTDIYYETTKPSGVMKMSYNLQLVHNCLLVIISLLQTLN